MYQRVIILGNLGRDPEMRYTPSGQAVTTFPVATNRTYTGADGQKVKETAWFRVTAWGKMAEACNNYLKRGSKCLVDGRLVPDHETGGPKVYAKKDGSSGASFEISATTVQFLDAAGENSGEPDDDSIPF